MLEEILDYIHNYFILDEYEYKDTPVEISSGTINLPFLKENQYFYIKGSIFNDGVHRYPPSDLVDEVFAGKIYSMAIPPKLLNIVKEIDEWTNTYGTVINSPFQSESFGGYSYTKASGNSSSGNSSIDWKDVFGNKLKRWRKIS